jgi:hypothetical protein
MEPCRATLREPIGASGQMSSIFISYRRKGATKDARALFERLSRDFGKGQVFIDLEGLEPGATFRDVLSQQLHFHVLSLSSFKYGRSAVSKRSMSLITASCRAGHWSSGDR